MKYSVKTKSKINGLTSGFICSTTSKKKAALFVDSQSEIISIEKYDRENSMFDLRHRVK